MKNDFRKEIIEFCRNNRVSTTEVADALGKSGVIPNIFPINPGQHKVGQVRCIFTANNSNYDVHDQVIDVKPEDVVIVFCANCEGRAIFGELVAKYILLYQKAAAVVVQGFVRDYAALRREGFAIWAEGTTPLGCYNTPAESFPIDSKNDIMKKFEGGIAICDDGGVTVIPKENVNHEMLHQLENIEIQEDIWFFCLDALKWNTKKIVCDKAYLKETDLLSSIHVDQLANINHFKNKDK